MLINSLSFLSLLDSEGRLSITSLGTYLMLFKLAAAPNPSVVDLGALLLALANYGHKRYLTAKAVEMTPEPTASLDAKAIEELTSKVNAMALNLGMRGR